MLLCLTASTDSLLAFPRPWRVRKRNMRSPPETGTSLTWPRSTSQWCLLITQVAVRPLATWWCQRIRNGRGLMPGYESASAAPRALEKHSSPVLTEQRTQGRVWWESDWAIHGQMLYKLQLPYKYMVPWFKKETSSKHHRNLLKILEQLFFSLLMLEIYSAFLRNHDFTYYLLLLDHIISILGLGRAESKL